MSKQRASGVNWVTFLKALKISFTTVVKAWRKSPLIALKNAMHFARKRRTKSDGICPLDESVGVIILTGAGDLAFCSGGDQSAW